MVNYELVRAVHQERVREAERAIRARTLRVAMVESESRAAAGIEQKKPAGSALVGARSR